MSTNHPGSAKSDGGVVFFNGNIHTLEADNPRATVLAVKGTELAYVGSDLKAAAQAVSPSAEHIDLQGLTAVPGLIDGHGHLLGEGLKLARPNVQGLSKAETLEVIRREAAARPAGEWILGYGWNQETWPGGAWPTKEELDAAAPDNPVALDRVDKHSMWVNSLVLRAAGLTDQSPDPPGGEYLRDGAGRLQGIVIGQAMWSVWNVFPPVDERGRHQALMMAQEEMLGYGLTSLMLAGATMADLDQMDAAYRSGDLKLRVRAMLWAGEKQDTAYLDAGRRKVVGLFDEHLSISGVKIHSDGSLGSRSAWLLEDYADRPGHRGGHNYSDEALLAIMERARDHDLGVSIHAIGDAAIRQAVRTMEKVLRRRPGDHRWRIEHFQVVTPEDLALALELGIVASLQTVGIMTDIHMAEDRLGPERLKRSYPWRKYLDGGGVLVNGSDGPVEPVNPFEGMYAAVTRRDLTGFPAGGWYPENCLTREEALKTYTTWAAWSEFNEHRKGSLKVGKLADFAVLDRDPLSCPEDEIKDIQAVRTVLGGETVHLKD